MKCSIGFRLEIKLTPNQREKKLSFQEEEAIEDVRAFYQDAISGMSNKHQQQEQGENALVYGSRK